jgi:hypothetical protein
MKLFPFTVSVNAAPPAIPDAGERERTDGSGLGDGELVGADGEDVNDELPQPQNPAIASSEIRESRTLIIPASALQFSIATSPAIPPGHPDHKAARKSGQIIAASSRHEPERTSGETEEKPVGGDRLRQQTTDMLYACDGPRKLNRDTRSFNSPYRLVRLG